MISIPSYFVEFVIYSFLGWLWESVFCTIRHKEWNNRGFLYGPVCPIYGVSVLIADIVFTRLNAANIDLPVVAIFFICMFGSAVIEFVTHWYLEKRFHATWWDYSALPFNIQGRVCLQVSAGFGAAGVLIVKYLLPFTSSMQTAVPTPVEETLSILLAALLGADIAITEASMSSLLQTIEAYKTEFDQRAEEMYRQLAAAPQKVEKSIAPAKESALNRGEYAATEHEDWPRLLAERYTDKMSRSQKEILQKIKRIEVKGISRKFENLPQLDDLKKSLKERKEKRT
ncbi:MAG: hypothetical protein LUE92_06975 [Clostridiales bacterium]|nr:hypothetical protein [Clostridiales bacterium]